MKVRASNGLVFDLPEAVATGLVGSEGSGFEFYTEPEAAPSAPEPAAESEAPKRRARKRTTKKAEG